MAEGEVIISTRLRNDGFIRDAKQLPAYMRKIGAEIEQAFKNSAANGSKSFESLKSQMKALSVQAGQIRGEMANIEDSAVNAGNATSKAFEEAKAKVEASRESYNQLVKQADAIYDRTLADMSEVSMGKPDTLDRIVNESLSANKEYQALSAQIDKVYGKLVQQRQAMDAAKQAAIDSSGTQGTEYKRLAAQLEDVTVKQALLKDKMNAAGNAAYAAQMEKAARANNSYSKSADKATKSSGGLLNQFVKLGTMLKLMLIRKALQAMIKAVREGFQNLAKANALFNAAMSQMATKMQTVKNSIATAFAPVVQALVPVFNSVADAVVRAFNAIAAFTAKLFGNSATFIAAKDSAVDYAASLDGAASSAKKAAKSMMAIDELNIVSNDDSSGSGSSGAAADMFEERQVGEGIASFVDKAKAKFEEIVSYLKDKFGPAIEAIAKAWDTFRTAVETAIAIVTEALKTFYETAIKPLAEALKWFIENVVNKIITVLAPIIAAIASSGIIQFAKDVAFYLDMMGRVINDLLIPAIQFLEGVFSDVFASIADAWAEYGAPILEKWESAKEKIRTVLSGIYETVVKPIFQNIMSIVDELWDDHLKGLWDNVTGFFGAFGEAAMELWNVIASFASNVAYIFGPIVTAVINGIVDTASEFFARFVDILSGVIRVLKGVMEFLTGAFTGDWSKMWTGIKNIVGGVFDSIVGIIKGTLNIGISLVNGFISGIYAGLNAAIRAINALQINIPSWIPGLGGKTLGFSFTELVAPQIPKLAQGAVIPPNREFLAVLGDQKSGTNIETPLATMMEAFKAALAAMEYSGNGDIAVTSNIVLDGQVVATTVNKYNRRSGSAGLVAIREEMG